MRIAYEVAGDGDPVLLVHGALIADTFAPLLREPALRGHRCISYHRRGYAGTTHPNAITTVADHAADARTLLARLGVARAHVVGHSFGGSIAMQLALESPELVRTLVVMEPAFFGEVTAQGYRDTLAASQQRYRDAGAELAVDEFLLPRFGPGYRGWLDRAVPGAFAQAVSDAATWFEREVPGLRAWSFAEPEVRRITAPTLAVVGSDSAALWPRFGETHQLLLAWLPGGEGYVLPQANHGLQMQNPHALAGALAAFWRR